MRASVAREIATAGGAGKSAQRVTPASQSLASTEGPRPGASRKLLRITGGVYPAGQAAGTPP